MINRLIILFYIFGWTALSFGGTIDPKARDQDYIKYGEQHKCVLKMHGLTVNKELFRASCVIIDPSWVITAAHVIHNHTNHYIIYDNQQIKITKIILPNDFDIDKFGEKDIALCRLEKPVNLDFYPDLYGDTDEVGKVGSIAGFGDTGNFSTGCIISDGKKRAGTNIIDNIEGDMMVCSVATLPNTSMEFLIAHGDSGGGLFINNQLAGIHSGIWNNQKNNKPKATYSTFSGHTRISQFKVWIKTILDKEK